MRALAHDASIVLHPPTLAARATTLSFAGKVCYRGVCMERRERPNIDTVREILREEEDRVKEEPPPAPPEDNSDEAGREDQADS
jgi:hypothetical protein